MDIKPKTTKGKRRNNEKRKEKSRDAARSRRSRETEIFTDLGNALPLTAEQITHLDKASVMRLAISFLRVRDMIKLVPILPLKDKLTQKIKMESFFLKALEGFLLAISLEGDFVYTSENVNEYLGIPQIDLMGQNVFEYSHPCDHEEIRDILAEKTRDNNDDTSKSFFIRLKCTLTSKGRSVNLKSATYKVIHCTGHIIKDNLDKDKEANGSLLSCFVAIGQPIPHPSNIDTPLPRQTFLTKHSLDMKFTDADDEFMTDTLGYTPEDLIGKSVYDYHHAMDGEAIGSAFKCLFSKGQCETSRYRFLAKTGGYVWVVTQATLIHDKNQKPQSVVCVNYVISGVECKEEIYAAHQLASVETEAIDSEPLSIKSSSSVEVITIKTTTTPPPAQAPVPVLSTKAPPAIKPAIIPKTIIIPEIRVESIISPSEQKKLIEKTHSPSSSPLPPLLLSTVKKLQISRPAISAATAAARPKPVSVTAKLLSSYEPPSSHDPEFIIFKPTSASDSTSAAASAADHQLKKAATTATVDQLKSESDMSKRYLSFSDDDSSFTMLKDEQEDLTHLAPVAGDVCVPLDLPYIDNMFFEDILLKDDLGPLLNDKPSDPFISYRNLRDSSPQLSPNLSKSSDCSLTSLSSPNSSLLEEDQMSSFMNFPIDDDLGMKTSSFMPMSFTDELSIITNDYIWNQNENRERNKNDSDSNIPESNSTLAQMLSSSVNKHTLKSSDRGGGGGDGDDGSGGTTPTKITDVCMESNSLDGFNEKNSDKNWSTNIRTTTKLDTTITIPDNNNKLINLHSSQQRQQKINRSPSVKRSNLSNNYTQQNKRCKNEPKDTKMSPELLQQLMSNNHQRGRPPPSSKNKDNNNWLLNSGNKAACISQPSDSVLMNLLVSGFDIRAGYICLAPSKTKR